MVFYTLDDFTVIKNTGFEYKLDEQITNIIQKLSTDLGINTIASPHNETNETKYKSSSDNFNKYNGQHKFKRSKPNAESMNTNKDWERIRSFKTTKIEKKEGIEQTINDVRICLNKLSEMNYEIQRDTVFNYISMIMEEIDVNQHENENLLKVTTIIFDIASTNKFYSELYAILYKELTDKFPIFKEIIITIMSQYLEKIGKIQFVDSEKDYDRYCDNNKENDKRKATSTFLVNLMKLDLISVDEIMNIILMLQETVLSYIDQENKSYEVEEISENIYTYISTFVKVIEKKQNISKDKKMSDVLIELIDNIKYNFNDITVLEKWNAILENIKICSQYKQKEHLSISSRTIFRYMDMLDILKKHKQ